MELLLREGQPFEQVIREFLEWCGPEEYRFCSWGPMDLTELERNIAYYGMEIPFERPLLYYDIQKLYSLEYGDGKSRAALDQAVCEQDLADEGGFHRAFNDASIRQRFWENRYGAVWTICVCGLLSAA